MRSPNWIHWRRLPGAFYGGGGALALCGVVVSAPGVVGTLPLATRTPEEVTCPSCLEGLAGRVDVALKRPAT